VKQTLDAIAALIPYTVYNWAAETPGAGQYVVLWTPPHSRDEDEALIRGSAFTAPLRVTAVAGTLDGVQIMLDRMRPLLDTHTASVAGRHVLLTWDRSETIDLDRTVTIPTTDRHPAFGVDTFTIHSQPI
jgi:hypothetical protein